MEDMNDILNPPKETEETDTQKEYTEVAELAEAAEEAKPSVETTQVTAETTVEETPAQVKSELAALVMERRRIRQKEAALDEERARLTAASTTEESESKGEVKDPQTELKELRKQHRAALSDSLLDPNDEEASKAVDDLEDRMESLRLSIVNSSQREMSEREKADNDFKTEYAAVHKDFPFLDPKHEKANADLNENINTYMNGMMAQGVPKAAAMRKAVDLFAPSYARTLEDDPGAIDEETRLEKKAAADKLIKDKLSRGGFSEVRSVGRREGKQFTGPTPMKAILGGKT